MFPCNNKEIGIRKLIQQSIIFRIVSIINMSTEARPLHKASNEIFVGKKPLMTYVTATLVQLANEPTVVIKARGKTITRAVDIAQIIVKRMDTIGYNIGQVKLGSEAVQSEDGRTRNVSTIEVPISRVK